MLFVQSICSQFSFEESNTLQSASLWNHDNASTESCFTETSNLICQMQNGWHRRDPVAR